jgi:putative DNA primase/helicase
MIDGARGKGYGRTEAPEGDPGENAWPDPQSIPETLYPVEPFDMALLPESLRGWIADGAERMQCPPDFPAVGAMVALSSVIGRKCVVRPKRFDDWEVVPNLWGGVVGRPGIMKSPALSFALNPLDRLQVGARDAFKAASSQYENSELIRDMQAKAAKDRAQKLIKSGKIGEAEDAIRAIGIEDDEAPTLRRYKVTDTTVEALGEILIENPWGVLAYRDELYGLLRGLDKEGQEGSRAFYLQGYDGNQGYTFDRIMRGRNLHIDAVCIAMLGGIQPGKLKSFIREAVTEGSGDDGLLQRFSMLVWPDPSRDWKNVDRWPDTAAKTRAFGVFERLDRIEPDTDPSTGAGVSLVFCLSGAAQSLFDDWRATTLEPRLRDGSMHPALESHLAKYRKLVPAVALVCALAEGEDTVSEKSMLLSLAWAEYLESHARRIYGAGTGPDVDGAKALLTKIRARALCDGFKASDIYLKGWSGLSSVQATRDALRILCDLGYLRMVATKPGPSGGRPSEAYQINPAVFAEV